MSCNATRGLSLHTSTARPSIPKSRETSTSPSASPRPEDPFRVAADLKVEISRETGLRADFLDIRVINDVDDLLYLRNVLGGRLLVDKDPELRGAFLESFAMKYRASEGILAEAYGP